MINKVTGKSRAFVFVEFATPAEAAKVVKRFHGKDFQGRPHTGNIPPPRCSGSSCGDAEARRECR